MVVASLGSCAVDQFWFFLGRGFRDHKWVAALGQRPAFADAIDLIEGRPILFILSFRFAYGLRSIAPVAIGTSRLAAWRFVLVNIFAATIWGQLFVTIGYAFAKTLERYVPQSTGTIALAVLLIAVVSILSLRAALRRK